VKWIALAVVMVAWYPAGVLARSRPAMQRALAVLVGFLPFHAVDLNILSFEAYRGDTRGLELSLVDFVALALFVATPKGAGPPPFRTSRALYLAVALISIALAPIPLFASFATFKLARCYLLFLCVHRASRQLRADPWFLTGLSLGLVYATGLCLWQRYGLGMMQAPGPFPHQNGLAMAANMIFPAALAVSLAGQGGRAAVVTVGAAALCVVLTLSRGGMMMFVLAAAIVFVGSTARRATPRKVRWLAAALLGGAALLTKSWDTVAERFLHAAKSSEEAREYFEEASQAMLHDHPFGIGMNQYSHVLSSFGYGERVGMDVHDQSGIVHNIYWLTAAELGYHGLLALALLLAQPLYVALRSAARDRTLSGDVLLGVAASLTVTYLQGKLEWSLRMTTISQILFVLFGLVAALGSRRPR
jgi:O-antigen ligase